MRTRSTSLFLALASLAAATACTTSRMDDQDSSAPADAAAPDAAGDSGGIDGGVPIDGGRMDSGTPDGGGCGPECPPGFCFGGVCTASCCDTGECGPGFVCNFGTCGCIPATGCCATGGTCPSIDELCWDDCTCVTRDDCRLFGCRDIGFVCDFTTGTCSPDTSCGDCGPDRICAWGTCTSSCWIGATTCPDGLVCSESEGCVAPRCSDVECASYEPPQRCDPTAGCYDPCARDDWSWCTAMGGYCYLGNCIDDTCSGSSGIGCHYRYDCCGNPVCTRDDRGDPSCPGGCAGEPYVPPRDDLCRCQAGGTECVDTWGGGGIIFPPEPFPGGGPR